jgi:cation diffusion facilitator family transporter
LDPSQALRQKNIFSAQYLLIGVALVLLVVKFTAFFLTNSNAILTDAMESMVNVVTAFFGLYSMRLAFLPADRNHPYGHGKIEFLAAGFEGILICIAGFSILGKSVYNLFYPQVIMILDKGILLTLAAGLVNFVAGYLILRKGKKTKSLILQSGGKHLLSDAWSSVILILGLWVVVYFEFLMWDSILAIFLSGYIVYMGWGLVRTSVSGIMDEADSHSIEELVGILSKERRENWIDIHNFRIIKYGSSLHVDCHVTMPYYLNVAESHAEVELMDALVNDKSEIPIEWFVHVDPCDPSSCKLCIKKDCPVREEPFDYFVPWTLESIVANQKHAHQSSKKE